MIKKKHREYKLEDLHEADDSRMVDGYVNPNKSEYKTKDFELGIDDKLQAGSRRWTLDTYKERGGEHKTPQMKENKMKLSDLKKIIKEVLRESLYDERSSDYGDLIDKYKGYEIWMYEDKEVDNKKKFWFIKTPDGTFKEFSTSPYGFPLEKIKKYIDSL